MTLPNYNGAMRLFVPELMGGPAGSATTTPLRTCFVTDGCFSTYVIPGDWPKDIAKWAQPGTHFKPSTTNAVHFYAATSSANAGGLATYAAMKEAFDTATGDGHFILLAGWSHGLDFALDGVGPTGPGSGNSMRAIWTDKAKAGVKIRTLLWRPGGRAASLAARAADTALNPANAWQYRPILGSIGQNAAETAFINSLDNGAKPALAIGVWDDNLKGDALGSHHQKILIVYGSQGLIAFFGGVDILDDRVIPDGKGAPQHDVHCRVCGDAAGDLLNLWIDRWNGCREAAAKENASVWASLASARGTPDPAGPGHPRQEVQIGQTIGNANITAYPSDGLGMLLHCIQTAKKFIYMQDQYFWSLDAATALNAAVPRLDHLTIIVPHPSISSPMAAGMVLRREAIKRLIQGLSQQDIQKIGIYCPVMPGAPGTYVHSKMWVFDDECAIIGSSNCNNRGYIHDSELMGRVSEGAIRTFDDLDINFARKLRMTLWHLHLGGMASMESLYHPSSVCYFRLQEWSLSVTENVDDFGGWWNFTQYNDTPTRLLWASRHPIDNAIMGDVLAGSGVVDPR